MAAADVVVVVPFLLGDVPAGVVLDLLVGVVHLAVEVEDVPEEVGVVPEEPLAVHLVVEEVGVVEEAAVEAVEVAVGAKLTEWTEYMVRSPYEPCI
mmetsp:Transcript_25976/g.35776  ORF Transcript_25976/g.35776 Transcript_25976/m.35776 type:complete len:96 (-) Transcript_25976:211-498(-)